MTIKKIGVLIIALCTTFLMLFSLVSCKKKETPIEPEPEDPIPYEFVEGSTIYINMGTYPQTVVSDIPVADIKSGTYDEATGYYKYKDNYYSVITAHPCTDDMTAVFSNGDAVQDGKEYAFKVEPIKWRIINKALSQSEGYYFVYSTKILDVSIFQQQSAFGYSSTYEVYYLYKDGHLREDSVYYANNWEASILRLNLNNFYTKSFTDANKTAIRLTKNVNKSPDEDSNYFPSLQKDTDDYVYVLSYAEATNPNYSFTTMDKGNRLRQASDYAIAKGLFCLYKEDICYGWAWTRSGANKSNNVYMVDVEGNLNVNFILSDSDNKVGFAPAMKINII